jgi:hypothetical protein
MCTYGPLTGVISQWATTDGTVSGGMPTYVARSRSNRRLTLSESCRKQLEKRRDRLEAEEAQKLPIQTLVA